MNIQEIMEKAQNSSLTEEEQQFFLKELDKEMLLIKEKDPKKYLQLLKTLNEAFQELNEALRRA